MRDGVVVLILFMSAIFATFRNAGAAAALAFRRQQQQQSKVEGLLGRRCPAWTTTRTTTKRLDFLSSSSSSSSSSSLRMTATDTKTTTSEKALDDTTPACNIIAGPDLPPVAPTAKRLFLVRHGEVINPGGDRPVYYGAMDVPLSPLGEQEAAAAGRYLSQFDLSHVFSSPLSRAMYGAERVLDQQRQRREGQKKEIAVLDGFKELDRGAWCGKTKGEIGSDAMARFDACDESVTPAGGESYPAFKGRVLEARDMARATMRPGEQAALVSHLQVTRSMLSEALGIPTNEMASLKIATASVTCIDYYDETVGAENPAIVVHYQSFKPDAGLQQSKDGAN